MNHQPSDSRVAWMLAGLVAGVALSYLWPLEHVQAGATDSDEKLAITTVDTGVGQPEAVFVLDSATGRIVGSMMSQQAQIFTNFFAREISGDFKLDSGVKPKFVMIPGYGGFANRGANNAQLATGVLYVAELTSGQVVAYGFTVRNSNKKLPPVPLQPIDAFPFRQAVTE